MENETGRKRVQNKRNVCSTVPYGPRHEGAVAQPWHDPPLQVPCGLGAVVRHIILTEPLGSTTGAGFVSPHMGQFGSFDPNPASIDCQGLGFGCKANGSQIRKEDIAYKLPLSMMTKDEHCEKSARLGTQIELRLLVTFASLRKSV